MTRSTRRQIQSLLFVALFAAAAPGMAAAQDGASKRTAVDLPTFGTHFISSISTTATSDKSNRPLVVLLHGCGGCAGGGNLSTAEGMLDVWEPAARAHGYHLLALQSAEVQGWTSNDDRIVLAAIERFGKDQKLDLDRVFLCGFSAGASLASIIIARHPDRFRALAAVGGGIHNAQFWTSGAEKRARYLLTGTRDNAISSVLQVAEQWTGQGASVRLEVVPGMGHDCPASITTRVMEFFNDWSRAVLAERALGFADSDSRRDRAAGLTTFWQLLQDRVTDEAARKQITALILRANKLATDLPKPGEQELAARVLIARQFGVTPEAN